jgi:hypothetical protein
MCASPLDFLRSGPPPPRVAILPDSVFFSRAIAVEGAATRAEVVAQVTVALEALSPFPLAQLYYGYYWPEGSDRALAYASYRRRFTTDQLESWAGADLVIPAFATVLGLAPEPATTVVLASAGGLTALRWDRGAVPAMVLFQPLAPEAAEPERASARAALIKACGEARTLVDIAAPPAAQAQGSDSEFTFRAGDLTLRIPAATAAALDVRDKADLEALGRARRRDMLLWRVTMGAVAACLLMALGELALFGAGFWQSARRARVAAQKPTVTRIMEEKDLAERIDDLSTKRLLPLEMISLVSPDVALPKSPPAIQFLHASCSTAASLSTIQIEAQTNNAGEIAGYKTALEQTPGCERVEIRDQRTHDNVVTFTLVVTFKPGAFAPASS